MGQEVTDEVEGVAPRSAGRACAAACVGVLAILVALLPALVAIGLTPIDAGSFLARGVATLAAGLGGAKLAAVLWGLPARFLASPEPRIATAPLE